MTVIALALAAFFSIALPPPEGGSAPPELGLVRFERDLDAGLAAAESTGKPVFLLFQEIPGCSTCVSFGEDVLSHPLLVDAIEAEFVPVAIHNNKPGKDADALARYSEPSWNNPVVRFVDSAGKDLLPRKDGVTSAAAIAERAVRALEAARRPVPRYLRLLLAETAPKGRATAAFAMHCFWEGEARLGAIDGVLATRAGFLDGQEVVEVVFDPGVVAFDRLAAEAKRLECAAAVYAPDEAARSAAGAGAKVLKDAVREAPRADQKHALSLSPLRLVPMTESQAARVNAAVARGEDPADLLSPSQAALAKRIAAGDAARLEGLLPPADLRAWRAYFADAAARLGGQ